MKISVIDRVEQGTPSGAMKFVPGRNYRVAPELGEDEKPTGHVLVETEEGVKRLPEPAFHAGLSKLLATGLGKMEDSEDAPV